MSVSKLSKNFFQLIDERIGPFDRPFQFRPFPFDAGGSLNFLTIGAKNGEPFIAWDILYDKNQFVCSSEIAEIATRDLIENGKFDRIVKCVQTIYPDSNNNRIFWTREKPYLIRNLRINAYSGDIAKLEEDLSIEGFTCSDGENLEKLVNIYKNPFSLEYFEKLPINFRFLILNSIILEMIESLEVTVSTYWELVQKYFFNENRK